MTNIYLYFLLELFISAFCLFAGIMEYKSKRHIKSMALLFISGMATMALITMCIIEIGV